MVAASAYAVMSASAATVRQFLTVTTVGRRRFVSASISFERRLAVGEADEQLAADLRQLVRRVAVEVAEPEP